MGCLCPASQDTQSKLNKRSSSLNSISLDEVSGMSLEAHANFYADYILASEAIGIGKHGVIKLCHKKITGKKFAVKVIKKALLAGEARCSLTVRRQVQFLSGLSHPSLLKIHAFYEDHLNYYIVMDHVNQGDLFERLRVSQKFCETCTSQIMRQIFSALAYLHSKGMAHRDIKLENILLEENGPELLVKVIDFDTAVQLDGSIISELRGSLPYVAPEVIERGYNEKCDVWSAGVAMFAMLTGRYPFLGSNADEIRFSILNEDFDIEVTKELSGEAVGLIRKLLEKDFNKRYSAAEAYRHGWILKNGYFVNEKPRSLPGYDPVSHGVKLWALQHAIDDHELVHFELVFLHSDSNLDGFLDVDELSEYSKISVLEDTLMLIFIND